MYDNQQLWTNIYVHKQMELNMVPTNQYVLDQNI